MILKTLVEGKLPGKASLLLRWNLHSLVLLARN